MLTRDALAALDWRTDDWQVKDGGGATVAGVIAFDAEWIARLLAAAPALALACLDALAFISWYSDSDDSMSAERQEKEDLVPRIRAALAAAGVAPGPEGGA